MGEGEFLNPKNIANIIYGWFIQRASSAAPTGGGASTRGGGATEGRRTAATAAMKQIAHEIAPICDVQEDDSFVPSPPNLNLPMYMRTSYVPKVLIDQFMFTYTA